MGLLEAEAQEVVDPMTRTLIIALSVVAVASLTAQALYWRHHVRNGRGDGVAVRGAVPRVEAQLPPAVHELVPLTLTAVRPPVGDAPMPTVFDE